MKDDPIIALVAKFGPILKAAFPNEHRITRFDVANALAEAAIAEAGKPAPSEPPAVTSQSVGRLLEDIIRHADGPASVMLAKQALSALAEPASPPPAGEQGAEEWDGPLTAEEQAKIDAAWEKHKAAGPVCRIPPEGWSCSRVAGHDGPCAASPPPVALPDSERHKWGWDAAKIDGVWCVGMKGNLDTSHDAVLRITGGFLSDDDAKQIALWIVAKHNTDAALTPTTTTTERGRG